MSPVDIHMALTEKKLEHYRKSPTCFKDRLLRTSWPLSVKVYLFPLQTCSNHGTNGQDIDSSWVPSKNQLDITSMHKGNVNLAHTYRSMTLNAERMLPLKIMLNDHQNKLKWRPVQTMR